MRAGRANRGRVGRESLRRKLSMAILNKVDSESCIFTFPEGTINGRVGFCRMFRHHILNYNLPNELQQGKCRNKYLKYRWPLIPGTIRMCDTFPNILKAVSISCSVAAQGKL